MSEFIPPFPQIELTPQEQARYDRNVTSFLCDAVAEYSAQSGHTNQDAWTHVRRRKQLNIYKSVYGTRDPRVTLLKGTGLINGPVEDVMDGLYCDTTEDLRSAKTLLNYKFVDGCIMNVSESRSMEAPYRFAGIKWFAAKAAWGLSKHRDVLAYERMGTTKDSNGNELAYHVLHSIDHPDWPIDAIRGIKREHQVTCYLYKRHDDTHVECFIWSTVYNLDSVAQRLAEYVVGGVLLNVTMAVKSARAKKYSQLMKHAQRLKWPANSLCHICYGRSFISSNRPCAGCFQSVCKSCSDYRHIFHVDARTGRPHQQRFCKLCINSTVVISSQDFEATLMKARRKQEDTETSSISDVDRVELSAPKPKGKTKRKETVQAESEKLREEEEEEEEQARASLRAVHQTSQSVIDSSLRSNYLDIDSFDSDWSSVDEEEEFMQRLPKQRVRSMTRPTDMISLSDLAVHSEDEFEPYPRRRRPTYAHQMQGRYSQQPQQHYEHQYAGGKMYYQQQRSVQHPVPQQQPEEYWAPPPPAYSQLEIPPFRSPYEQQPRKMTAPAYMHSRAPSVPTSSPDGVDDAQGVLVESGLSHFDLGVEQGAPVEDGAPVEFDGSLSLYSVDEVPSARSRAPRYMRTSRTEKDKEGFLSDLYSLSRSRLHGNEYY